MSGTRKPIRFITCQVERTVEWRKRNYVTGEIIGSELKTHPCNNPLFTATEMFSGICEACLYGWETPGSFVTEKGRAFITKAQAEAETAKKKTAAKKKGGAR